MNPRRLLLESLDTALRAVDGRCCVSNSLCSVQSDSRVAVFAIGKAASAMTRGALDTLRDQVAQALVVTKDGHVDPELMRHPGVVILEAAHPVPDARSLDAGAALGDAVRSLAPDLFPIFLVSGGSSSLVESLHEGRTLADLRVLNERGLAAGWDIATLNVERSKLSRLKAGGIARLLDGRRGLALFISDVPDDDVRVIGSGLLGDDGGLPDAIERHVVANVERAVDAVVEVAATNGLRFEPGARRLSGDAERVAAEFLEALRATTADGLVWGGESTVTLPTRVGRGGRNTHLALALAIALAREPRRYETISILAAGTDGTDGPTSDAGAIVDSGTVDRAELGGCDVERAFREFDSGTALEAAEDLVHTGPTGTNVGDLLIGCKRAFRVF